MCVCTLVKNKQNNYHAKCTIYKVAISVCLSILCLSPSLSFFHSASSLLVLQAPVVLTTFFFLIDHLTFIFSTFPVQCLGSYKWFSYGLISCVTY